MPGGDRTGPLGQGPGSGRVYGYCYGFGAPGYIKVPGRGMCRGYGFERGFGRSRGICRGWNITSNFRGYMTPYHWMPSMSREDEITMLITEADGLKRSQQDIEKRLAELEKEE